MKYNGLEGIDIDALANSEESIVEPVISTEPLVEDVTGTERQTGDELNKAPDVEPEPDAEEGISLEELANQGDEDEEIIEEEVSLNNEDGIKDTSQAPAKTKGKSPSSQIPYASLASALYDAGVLSEDDELENVEDAEALMSLMAKQIKANELSDLNDTQKEYLEALRSGVPHQEYAAAKTTASQYEALTDEVIEGDEKMQHELVRRSFIVKGFSDAKAKAYADSLTSPEEAIAAKSELIAHSIAEVEQKSAANKAIKAAEAKKEAEYLSELKSKINESSEIIPGIKINATTKTKIYNSLVTPVENKGGGELANDVMKKYSSDDDYKTRLHALDVITKGFTDFSKIAKTEKSNAVRDLDTVLKTTSNSVGGSGKSAADRIKGSTTRSIGAKMPDFGSMNKK